MAWNDLITTIRLPGAQFVGAVKDGGVVIETHDIEYREGRVRETTDHAFEEGATKHLGMAVTFGTVDAPPPDAYCLTEARIIIRGEAKQGFIELRGDGWFGYDEKGNIDGNFNSLPAMLVLETVPYPPHDEPEMTTDEWMEHIGSVEPQTSEQYEWAGRGRFIEAESSRDDEDD
jgi:hypothetical protein